MSIFRSAFSLTRPWDMFVSVGKQPQPRRDRTQTEVTARFAFVRVSRMDNRLFVNSVIYTPRRIVCVAYGCVCTR